MLPSRRRAELTAEHTPTYTTGRRDNSPNPDTLHPEEKKVQNVGASFFITKRGGQVTYHGPGQLVGYPILDLNNMEVSGRSGRGRLAGSAGALCVVRTRRPRRRLWTAAHAQTPTKCYVDWLQSVLADYIRDQGCEGILAPHPEGHVGVFASPTEKVRRSLNYPSPPPRIIRPSIRPHVAEPRSRRSGSTCATA